jgi:DNA gyrase inhibitor GyrI
MPSYPFKIVELKPMRVASVRAVSATPELDAWAKMQRWAEPAGLLADIEKHPIFGFNNPSPEPGSSEYGYEFWLAIDPDTVTKEPVHVKDFSGGLFAVATCEGISGITNAWQALLASVKASNYHCRNTHELEQLHGLPADDDQLVVDLYLPIEQ